jgi:hypothetical protein
MLPVTTASPVYRDRLITHNNFPNNMNPIHRVIQLLLPTTLLLGSTGSLQANNPIPSPAITQKVSTTADQFPPRKIASRQAIGRLDSLVWGDYFYAKFQTKTGELWLMIDGQEDCLLKQRKNRTMKIRYDEIDRYIPLASGYHRVNIIRQVDNINVAKWQKTFSVTAAKKCQAGENWSR